jgi:hypothetical protein
MPFTVPEHLWRHALALSMELFVRFADLAKEFKGWRTMDIRSEQ